MQPEPVGYLLLVSLSKGSEECTAIQSQGWIIARKRSTDTIKWGRIAGSWAQSFSRYNMAKWKWVCSIVKHVHTYNLQLPFLCSIPYITALDITLWTIYVYPWPSHFALQRSAPNEIKGWCLRSHPSLIWDMVLKTNIELLFCITSNLSTKYIASSALLYLNGEGRT